MVIEITTICKMSIAIIDISVNVKISLQAALLPDQKLHALRKTDRQHKTAQYGTLAIMSVLYLDTPCPDHRDETSRH
jgi:hypothetical protein